MQRKKYSFNGDNLRQRIVPSSSLLIRRNNNKDHELRPFTRQLDNTHQNAGSTHLDKMKGELSQLLTKKNIQGFKKRDSTVSQNHNHRLSYSNYLKDEKIRSRTRNNIAQKQGYFAGYRARKLQQKQQSLYRKQKTSHKCHQQDQQIKDVCKKSFTIKQIRPQPKMRIIKDNIVFMNGNSIKLDNYYEMVSIQKSMESRYLYMKNRNSEFRGKLGSHPSAFYGKQKGENNNKANPENYINCKKLQYHSHQISNWEPWHKEEDHDSEFL